MRLEGKVAIVTGATSGMGRAAAIGFAREGAKVTAVGRNTERLAEVEKTIKGAGGECLAVQADLTQLSEIDKVVQGTVKEFGRLDVLVNCAATFELGDFLEATEEFFDRTMNTNVKSQFFMSQRAAREMKEVGKGKIINFASIAGAAIGFATGVAYCASKAAISGMTRALAIELAPYKIRVNTILPGTVQTGMNKHLLANPEYRQAQLDMAPLGYLGETSDMTPLVIYLASDESDYATGAEFTVDGGWTAA